MFKVQTGFQMFVFNVLNSSEKMSSPGQYGPGLDADPLDVVGEFVVQAKLRPTKAKATKTVFIIFYTS